MSTPESYILRATVLHPNLSIDTDPETAEITDDGFGAYVQAQVWIPSKITNPLCVYRARQAAGWETRNGTGWWAPCGTSESEWAANGWPFPEESGFTEWFSAANH